MAISIVTQPAASSLNAAYRPIIIQAAVSVAAPITYCDIYFNGVFYMTISLTSGFKFDIQDAAQEYLQEYLGIKDGPNLETATPIFTSCQCKLRASTIDGDGFTVPEAVVPVQATGGTAAVSGTGLATNTFYIVNSTLQHGDNQVLPTHLALYKSGTWNASAWPLTHRPARYKVAGSDFFPFVYTGSLVPDCVRVHYTLKAGGSGTVSECGGSVMPTCPVVTGLDVNWTDAGSGNQTFSFNWGAPSPLISNIAIEYRVANSSVPWSTVAGTGTSPIGRSVTLPHGLYDFRFLMSGSCTAAYSSTIEDQGIPVSACVAPSMSGTLPDATVGVLYLQNIPITGTASPFVLSVIVKPSWMTISIVGTSVRFTGTPSAADPSVDISFTVTNACGTYDFVDNIGVIAETGSSGTITMDDCGSGESITGIEFDDEPVTGTSFPIVEGEVKSALIVNPVLNGILSFIISGHTGSTNTRVEVYDSSNEHQCLSVDSNGPYFFTNFNAIEGESWSLTFICGGNCP